MQQSAIFNITGTDASLTPGATYKPLMLTIKNIGNEAAQQLTFSLQFTYPITPATSTAYVNNLDPGQSANVVFYVNVDQNGNSGTYPLTIYEQWKQPNGAEGQQFSASQNYFSQVSSSSGKSGYGAIIGAAIVLVAIVVGAYLYMKRKKSKAAGSHKAK